MALKHTELGEVPLTSLLDQASSQAGLRKRPWCLASNRTYEATLCERLCSDCSDVCAPVQTREFGLRESVDRVARVLK